MISLNYDYCIRFIEAGTIKTRKGSLCTSKPLDNANDIFTAIEADLPVEREYETFSICEFKPSPSKSL